MPVSTPYVTPQMITNAPTGVSWSIIPFPKATTQQQYAEQLNICHRATGLVNGYVNQVLRATIDTEQQSGPDYRVTIEQATGNARAILQRWPVTQILAAQVSPNQLPRQWTQVPSGYWDIEHPTLGVYGSSVPSSAGEGGQSVLIGGGLLDWSLGRKGYRLSVSYVNGWPHAGLAVNAAAGATTIHVDDVTGFGITDVAGFTGASAFIYDGASTESVTVTGVSATTPLALPNGGGTAQAGPGTLTLAAPLTNAHTNSGVVVSSFPQDILWATILAAATQALESGITAVSIQNVTGSQTVGGHGVEDLELAYERILEPYRRVI
jgi:hypothetical protein